MGSEKKVVVSLKNGGGSGEEDEPLEPLEDFFLGVVLVILGAV